MSEFACTQVMRFTEQGLATVRLAIEGLRDQGSTKKGSQGTPITSEELDTLSQLALRQDLVEPYAEKAEIDTSKQFASRYDMGHYLAGLITHSQAERDAGLWTWSVWSISASYSLGARTDCRFSVVNTAISQTTTD